MSNRIHFYFMRASRDDLLRYHKRNKEKIKKWSLQKPQIQPQFQSSLDQKLVDWPKGSTPIRKGMELDIEKLKIYFENDLGITGEAMDSRQFDHGQSNPTFYVR